MALPRVLEPELMDSPEAASSYDAMDHAEVNRLFVADLLAVDPPRGDVLDLGTGTARIPIELCQRTDECRIMAVDAAVAMLELARYNIELASCIERIQLAHVDAKQLPFATGSFAVVMSNSIVHHIPEPAAVIGEAVRVLQPGGLIFFRDLLRPDDEETVQRLVATYAGEADELQLQMFSASLRAALSLAEIQAIVQQFGFSPDTVRATRDRHWTWAARTAKT